MREMARVVRDGGRVVVLEFCKPRVPVFGVAVSVLLRSSILPKPRASWISGAKNDAYQLSARFGAWPFPEREAFLAA